MFDYVPIKHKQMSFVSNGAKFKLYTVLNGLIFSTPTQPRISFERALFVYVYLNLQCLYLIGSVTQHIATCSASVKQGIKFLKFMPLISGKSANHTHTRQVMRLL
jgi:hypothetical protein